MKHKRLVAGVLSLALACTILSPLQLAFAEVSESGSDDGGNPSETKGLELSKTAVANGDGTYTITLEAYATGSSITSVVSKDVPTDIVLVLDQSGSMADPIGTVSFKRYTSTQNSYYYERRHNGGDANLYYSLSDGTYAAVSVKRDKATETQTQISNEDGQSYYSNRTLYRDYRDSLYAMVDGKLQKITIDRDWYGDYTYTLPDDTSALNGNFSWGDNSRPVFQYNIYTVSIDDSKAEYTYTYVDADGVTQTIGTSTGPDTSFDRPILYRRVVNETAGGSRLEALKTAVTTFADSVATKAKGADGQYETEDDVDHRIAVVGYATGDYSDNREYPKYENTELFIGATQYNYNVNASSHYDNAFQDMNTQAGYNNVIASKNALASRGATYTNYGLEMANGIFAANPVPEGERRNRVVIVFTDGQPGYSSYDSDVADEAIDAADITKNTFNATVYTVGIFSGADATSPGNEDGTNTEKANWFMQKLSSNNGMPKIPSYYLSAADADTLKNIFQQISDQIESGGSSITLDSEAVVKDIISPYFTLPENAAESDITVTSRKCVGVDLDGNYTWDEAEQLFGMATVENGQVSVTGFDFAKNWVGTETAADGRKTYHGKKLVISFTVEPKAGFLGGNDVPTNGAESGIYADNSADTALENFTQPTVNVPVKEPKFELNSKTIYEGNSTTVSGLYTIPTYTWQDDYVYITSSVDGVQDDETVTPTDCTDYTVTVTYTPKSDGGKSNKTGGGPAEVEKSKSGTATIHVLRPVVSAAVNDVQKYYGETYTLGDGANGTITLDWADAHTEHTNIPTVEGVAPVTANDYRLAYSVNETTGTSVAVPKADFDVVVKVMKGSDVIQDAQITTTCTHGCASHTDGKYKVHVQTCQLTITKYGGAPDEPYVFDICKDGVKYSEVTIVGNNSETICELPVGSYTIQEDTGWSWRYTPAYDVNEAVLSADNPTGAITCTNTKSKNYWLNGYSDVVTNVSGKPHTAG